MEQQNEWLSLHLFVNRQPLIHIIKAVLVPLSEEIETCSPACFFFISYWENGPHIRLRIKATPESIAVIKSHISDFIRSINEIYSTGAELLIRTEEAEYVPETARYGGRQGLLLAESHFDASSWFTLTVAKHYDLNSYSFVMSIALQAQIIVLYHSQLNITDRSALLLNTMNGWLPFAIKELVRSGQLTTQDNPEAARKDCLQYFSTLFAASGTTIIGFLRSLWDLLAASAMSADHPLYKWHTRNHAILPELATLAQQGKLEGGSVNPYHNYLSVLSSLIHMTNNRLSVNNSDESYLAYILIRFFQQQP